MTYYGSKELAASFRTVRNNTIKIAEEIPEDQYGFRAAPGCRSIGETLVHIAINPHFSMHIHGQRLNTLVGFDFFSFMGKLAAEEAAPRDKAAILALLRSEGDAYAQFLEGATEEFLAEQVTYPAGMVPPAKSRMEMLMSAKEHEMHHRGQLMTLQRMIGLKSHLTRHMEERVASMQAAAKA